MARRTKFNLLLLEEGEFLLEEYAALMVSCATIGATESAAETYGLESKVRGRLRLCTRSVFFESDDPRHPVYRFGFSNMPGKPTLMPAWPFGPTSPGVLRALTAESLSARDAIAFQITAQTEMKPGSLIGPYRARSFPDPAPAAAGAGLASAGVGGPSSLGAPPPGAHVAGRQTVVLALLHMNAAQVLPLVTQAWTIQQAAAAAPSGYERLAVEAILQPRRDGPFNLTLLGDYRERPLLPVAPQAISLERVFPLVTCPGRVMLTERALYVQPIPLNNVGGSDSVAVIPLRDIRRVMRRRRLQRETGLEVFLHESAAGAGAGVAPGSVEAAAGLRSSAAAASSSAGSSGGMPGAGASYFFGFQSRGDRDRVYRELLGVLRERRARARRVGALAPASSAGGSGDCDDELGDPSPDSIVQMTRAWQSRRVSNLDYLLFLNTVAGRSASDLTQYPVMPWVLADYSSDALDLTDPATFRDLSKPVGALNATRLARLRERYAEMPRGEGCDPPFLYGTHYSTPGYCLFWLVRAMPEHLLRLQSGRFDAADRLFFDVATAWAGVTSLNSDVKELTPEFYASDGSFLLIPEGLDLGVRQNGRRVGDVSLPPWALDCGEFVRLQREALECPFVSERLHLWVDLIFGHKQRGPAAEAADNVFFWLSYENAVDLDAIGDADRRCALQQQIAEFGQTPRQLFRSPHPNRTGPLLPASMPPAGSAAGTGAGEGFTAVDLAEAARDGSVAMQRLLLSESLAAVEDVLAYDGAAAPLRGDGEGEGGSSTGCVAIVPAAQTLPDGSLAGAVELPTLKASPLLLMHRALHGDAAPMPLSCLCPALGGRLLFVGSWDGSVVVIDTAAMAAPLPAASDPAPPGALCLHRLHMSPGAAVSCVRVVTVQTLRFGGAHGLAASRRPTRVSMAPAAGVAAFEGVDEESDREEGEEEAGGGEHSSAAAAAAPVPVRAVIAVVAAGSWDCTVSLQTVVLTEWTRRGSSTLRVTVDADATPDLRVKEHASPVTALTAWRARSGSSGRGGRPGVHVVTGDAQGKALWFAAHLGTAASASTSGSGQGTPPTGGPAPPATTAAAASAAAAAAQRDSRPSLLRLLRPRTPPRAAELLLDCDIQAACEELVPELARGKGEVAAGGVSGITDMAWAPPLLLPTMAPPAAAAAAAAADAGSAAAGAQPQLLPQGRVLTYQAHAFCYAATVDGRIAVFKASGRDAATGAAPSLRLHATISTGEVLRCIAVSHDGCCVATGGNAGRVRLWGTAELLERAAEGPTIAQDAVLASAQCQAVWGTTSSGAPLLVAAAADCAIASLRVGGDEVAYRNPALAALALRDGEAGGAGELPSATMGSPRVGGAAEGGRPRASVRFSTAGSMLGEPALLAAAAAAEAAAAAVESVSRAAPAARKQPPVPSVPVPEGNAVPSHWVTSLAFCPLHPGAAATAANSDAWGQQYLLAAGSRGGDVCLWTGKRHDFAGSAASVEEGEGEV